jgi:hypothetical protein
MQALTLPDHRARAVFCHWHLAKCFVNKQSVANIQFTDEAGTSKITMSVWMTIPTPQWHQDININVCVANLGDQLLGPVVLPNRLTGAA